MNQVTRPARGFARGLMWAMPIYVLLATAMGFVDFRIRTYPAHAVTNYIPAILNGTEAPPAKYRVIAPWIFDRLFRPLAKDPLVGWVVFRWCCLMLAWIACHALFSTWFDDAVATGGTILVAALLPFTFTNSTPYPDHLLDLALIAAGCAAIARRAFWALALVTVAAALNRETSLFLVLLYLLSERLTRQHLARVFAVGAVWLAVTAGVRLAIGLQKYNIAPLFQQNLEFLQILPAAFDPYTRIYAWFFILLIAGLAVPIVRTWPRQPRMVRVALLWVVPLFIASAMFGSNVIETRIFTPLLPMLAPGMLFAAFDPLVPLAPEASRSSA